MKILLLKVELSSQTQIEKSNAKCKNGLLDIKQIKKSFESLMVCAQHE